MARSVVFQGRKIHVAVEEETRPDGQTVRREIVIHPGAVGILPVIDRENICLLRSHRPVVGQTLWEIPAGTLEPGEAPDQAASRELAEETGYQARQWRKLPSFFSSPGIMTERLHLFVAEDLTPGELHLEPGEKIEPHTIAWQQAVAWVQDGTICDAKTIVAILQWQQMRK